MICYYTHTHYQMVYTLVNKGSNSLWEHALLDPHSKIKIKKPTSRDKLVYVIVLTVVCVYLFVTVG